MPIVSITLAPRRSYSQFKALAMCPRRWYLSRRYDPKLKSSALAEGDVFHIALGKFYRQADKVKGITAMNAVANEYLLQTKEAGGSELVQDKLDNKITLLQTMADLYWHTIAEQDLKHFEILEVESPFSLDLGEGLIVDGVIDMVVRDRVTGMRYIVEHKYQQELDDELLSLDLQSTIYVIARMKDLGILPVLYNVTRKPMQRQGKKETRQGFLARAASEVLEEMKDWRGYNTKEYTSRYFVRRIFSRGRTDMDSAIHQMRGQDMMMKLIEENPKLAYRNVGEQCLYFCPFKTICVDEDPLAIQNFFVDKQAPVEPKTDGQKRREV